MESFYIGDLKINMNPKFKDLGAKSVVYKYRDWSKDFHKKTITEPSVYISSPRDFEDPLDCVNPTRYDLLTDSQIFDKFYQESKKENPLFDFEQHFRWAYDFFINTPIRNPLEYMLTESRLNSEFNDRFGVLSVTDNPLSSKMWKKYGADNKGFCIGYDSEKLFNFLGGGSKVTYIDILPKIDPFEDFKIQHYKQVYFKTTDWTFEEYRLQKTWMTPVSDLERNKEISKSCIVEVLLGYDISESDKKEIIEIVEKNLPETKIIQLTKQQIIE